MRKLVLLLGICFLLPGIAHALEEYVPDKNTLALYHFNSPLPLEDAVTLGKQQNLYITGGKKFLLKPAAEGKFGEAYFSDGANAEVGYDKTGAGNSASLRVNGNDNDPSYKEHRNKNLLGNNGSTSWKAFSMEVWLKPAAQPNPNNGWTTVIGMPQTTTIIAYQVEGGLTPNFTFFIGPPGPNREELWGKHVPIVLPFEKWSHLAVTWDEDAGVAKFWINGTAVEIIDVTGKKLWNDEKTPLLIGNNWGENTMFSGWIDEVRISNIARDFSYVK